MKAKIIIGSLLLATTILSAKDFTNSIGMKFKDIQAGSFMMGTSTPSTKNCPKDNPFTNQNEKQDCIKKLTGGISKSETPAHKVSVKSFYMATTEVTQGQWYEIMGDNPANFKNGNPNMPVEQVSWHDANNFVKKLNKKEGTTKYRLPTEQEWEYSARAGSKTKWHFGDSENKLKDYAWYYSNSRNTTHPVAKKKPNSFGLYDMHGNVYEWTSSCYTEDYNKSCYKSYKVLRGGCWNNDAWSTRSANRFFSSPENRNDCFGFRLARTK
ncbi:MAG: formylglycine-generating enzyme family protein [Campylobacterota bacterium]|nr:formylglycine-generating enzyme family protein [Campylobacterota bacterium]